MDDEQFTEQIRTRLRLELAASRAPTDTLEKLENRLAEERYQQRAPEVPEFRVLARLIVHWRKAVSAAALIMALGASLLVGREILQVHHATGSATNPGGGSASVTSSMLGQSRREATFLALDTRRGSRGYLELCSATTGRVLRRIRTFGLVGSGLSITANGAALSPDAKRAYLVFVRHPLSIERVPTNGRTPTVITQGAQPSISPNGRSLAYESGADRSRVFEVRDLNTGEVRSIDLSRFIGHGNLLTGSIAWLPDGSDVAVVPSEVSAWDLVGRPPKWTPSGCSTRRNRTTCLLVVHADRAAQRLTVTSYALPRGIPNDAVIGTDEHQPAWVLFAYQHRDTVEIARLNLRAPNSGLRVFAIVPRALSPLLFNPGGTALLYYGPNRVLWKATVGLSTGAHVSRTSLGKACGAPEAW